MRAEEERGYDPTTDESLGDSFSSYRGERKSLGSYPMYPDTSHRSQDRQKEAHDSRARPKHFAEGDAVYTCNYRQGSSWPPDVMMEQEGCVLVRVRLADGRVIRRHKVQLKHRELDAREELSQVVALSPQPEPSRYEELFVFGLHFGNVVCVSPDLGWRNVMYACMCELGTRIWVTHLV